MPQGAVLYATVFHADCLDICNNEKKNLTEVTLTTVDHAKEISAMLQLPLLVGMNVHCDIASHEVHYDAFFSPPMALAVFHGRV